MSSALPSTDHQINISTKWDHDVVQKSSEQLFYYCKKNLKLINHRIPEIITEINDERNIITSSFIGVFFSKLIVILSGTIIISNIKIDDRNLLESYGKLIGIACLTFFGSCYALKCISNSYRKSKRYHLVKQYKKIDELSNINEQRKFLEQLLDRFKNTLFLKCATIHYLNSSKEGPFSLQKFIDNKPIKRIEEIMKKKLTKEMKKTILL